MNFIGQAKLLLFVRIIVATWLIARAVIALVPLIIVLYNSSFDVIYSSSNLIIFSSILSGGAFLGTAIGILKSKRWAVYAFIGITLLSFVSQFIYGTFQIDFREVAFDLFDVFLIFYLFQNRGKFEVGDKKKEDIFLGLSVLAFAVSIILTGFLVDKLNKFLDEQTQLPGTLNWQTYRNEEWGVEFQYPPTEMFIGAPIVEQTPFTYYYDETYKTFDEYEGIYIGELRLGCSIVLHKGVNPFEGNKYVIPFLVESGSIEGNGEVIYAGVTLASSAAGSSSKECKEIFNQILSTLRFTEKN